VAIAVSSRERALAAVGPYPPLGKLGPSAGPGLFEPPIESTLSWRELVKVRWLGLHATELWVARVMGAPIPVFLERLAGRSRATVVAALPQCRSDLAERGTLPDARAVAGRLGRGQVAGFGRSPVAILDRKEAS
jgi:hypothetical protein